MRVNFYATSFNVIVTYIERILFMMTDQQFQIILPKFISKEYIFIAKLSLLAINETNERIIDQNQISSIPET